MVDSISKIRHKRQGEQQESIKKSFLYFDSERKGFEPLVQLLVRFISNEVLLATQSSLHILTRKLYNRILVNYLIKHAL